MNLFIWGKNVSFARYLDFYIFVKSGDFKIGDVIVSIATVLLNSKYYQNET